MQTINIFINGDEVKLGCDTSLVFSVGPTMDADLSLFGNVAIATSKGQIEMELNLTTTQQTTARVKALKDRNGNPTPTPPGAAVQWSTDNDGSVLVVAAQPNGECVIRATGAVGQATVTATVSWDEGGTPREVSAALVVNVSASQPVLLELEFDPPVEQPVRQGVRQPMVPGNAFLGVNVPGKR